MKKHLITSVEYDSIALEMDIKPGDKLISINGKSISDVFDYRYLCQTEKIELLIEKPDGEEWLLDIEKDTGNDIGLSFETGLMDKPKSCRNKCVFCFIDQLPKNLRTPLYFKDDDVRLSFLTGNYVTLTNVNEKELDRMIYYHLSPINISVHTTDIKLRETMLRNPKAGNLIGYLEKIRAAGITMNFQIVLCRGINDGNILDKSIENLSLFIPHGRSLSVVPVGLTKHRAELTHLDGYDQAGAVAVLNQIEKWQKHFLEKYDTSFVYAADEFYLLSGRPVPEIRHYEDFPQIENGVGMLSLFKSEFMAGLDSLPRVKSNRTVSVVTGDAAYEFISGLCAMLAKKVDGLTINVYDIRNEFLGDSITVSGLLTGRDIVSQLKDKELGSILLIPMNALRSGSDVFLDDMSVDEMSIALNTKVSAVDIDGQELIRKILEE